MWTLFGDLERYVGFSDADRARLKALHATLAPAFPALIDAFYAQILDHPGARAVVERGEHQVGALKVTLGRWLDEAFTGPWDAAYVESRGRIGRVHVRIGLPQHYMVTAMNLVRRELVRAVLERVPPEQIEAASTSISRILDIDLALMLHAYRLDQEVRQARAERLATYGQLVGSIAHELRNPLGVIETSLYVLKGHVEADPRAAKHLDRIGQQVTLANDIITQLLNLIRDAPLVQQRVRLGALAAEATQAMAWPEPVSLELAGLDDDFEVLGDPTQLRQVVVNLVENAMHAAFPRGKVRVGLERRPREEGAELILTVDDSGRGIEAGVMARLFEPLVTNKSKGIGLGLALVRRIVERHGGQIEAGRGPLGGARLTVTLPEAAR